MAINLAFDDNLISEAQKLVDVKPKKQQSAITFVHLQVTWVHTSVFSSMQ